jgi:mono/diheme cytochrome c family protein
MRVVLILGFVALFAVLFVSVGPSNLAQESDRKAKVPGDARDKKNPIPVTPQSIEHGGKLYQSQCAMCHGESGVGDGDLAETLKMEVPDFTAPGFQDRYTDGEVFWIITNGHERMPADGDRFTADLRWHMVNFIRTFKPASR